MAKYEVVTPIHHSGKKYPKGSIVELDPTRASKMPNAVKGIVQAPAPDPAAGDKDKGKGKGKDE
jgi:hypothetical protein